MSHGVDDARDTVAWTPRSFRRATSSRAGTVCARNDTMPERHEPMSVTSTSLSSVRRSRRCSANPVTYSWTHSGPTSR